MILNFLFALSNFRVVNLGETNTSNDKTCLILGQALVGIDILIFIFLNIVRALKFNLIRNVEALISIDVRG